MNYKYLTLLVLIGCGNSTPQKPLETIERLKLEIQDKNQKIEDLEVDKRDLQLTLYNEFNSHQVQNTKLEACINSHQIVTRIAQDFVPSISKDEGALFPIAHAIALIQTNYILEHIDTQGLTNIFNHLVNPDQFNQFEEDQPIDSSPSDENH